jgi:predicted ribosome quality control (RQC) complex YloA/Tae2 family protein
MALKRSQLAALGIEPEKIDQIIESHAETVTALKDEVEKYKAEAEKLPGIQKELAELRKSIEGKDYDKLKQEFEDYKTNEYGKLKKEFDDYKVSIQNEKTQAAKEAAYREALKDANLSENGVKKAVKYADWAGVEIGEDGKLKNAKELVKAAREEWAEYIVKTDQQGVNTPNPPGGKGSETMTKEQIMAVKDRNERQRLISENHTLFGY